MRLALAQVFCPWGDAALSLDVIEHWSRQARRQGADAILFPELTILGIYKDPRVVELSEPLDGPSVHAVRHLARELNLAIAFGFSEKNTPLPHNTYLLLDATGQLAGVYRKQFIPKLEAPFWSPGHDRPVFDWLGKRVAVAICWDNCQPELLADYARRGAQIVLMPHAWDADPLDRTGKPLEYDNIAHARRLFRDGTLAGWKSHDQMRAYFLAYLQPAAAQGHFTALFVNQTACPHPCFPFVGPTFALDPTGRILAQTESAEEQLLLVDLPGSSSQ